ncbi:tetratricopeptide repeat protein [Candidatus Sumerlaeota bacterium]|nr:tetratricopeptide repeat protein [Candidatus Sumerlaeota bacterium]
MAEIWSPAKAFYYPLTSTVFWIERRLWGLNPLGYHLVNVSLHIMNALLLWRLLLRLRLRGALAAALLFAVHPVNVQSVAWATELKNTQSGFFYLLSLHGFVRAFETKSSTPKWGWYLASLAGFACALLSKTSTVVLPPVLFILALWRDRNAIRARGLWLLPYFLPAVGAGLLTLVFHRSHLAVEGYWNETPLQRLILAGRSVWFYLLKVLWPAQLSFVYPRWKPNSVDALQFVPLILLLGGAALGAIRARKRMDGMTAGAAIFVISLFPVLNFFRMYYTRYAYAADHWQYLACPAIIALLTGAMDRLAGADSRLKRNALAALALFLAMLTWRQSWNYRDAETLWMDTLRKNPTSGLTLTDLGELRTSQRRFAEAEELFRQYTRLYPADYAGHYNLAESLLMQEKFPDAAQAYARALELSPSNPKVMSGQAKLLSREGKSAEALALGLEILRIQPASAQICHLVGIEYARQGKLKESEDYLAQAAALDPANGEIKGNLEKVRAARLRAPTQ